MRVGLAFRCGMRSPLNRIAEALRIEREPLGQPIGGQREDR